MCLRLKSDGTQQRYSTHTHINGTVDVLRRVLWKPRQKTLCKACLLAAKSNDNECKITMRLKNENTDHRSSDCTTYSPVRQAKTTVISSVSPAYQRTKME